MLEGCGGTKTSPCLYELPGRQCLARLCRLGTAPSHLGCPTTSAIPRSSELFCISSDERLGGCSGCGQPCPREAGEESSGEGAGRDVHRAEAAWQSCGGESGSETICVLEDGMAGRGQLALSPAKGGVPPPHLFACIAVLPGKCAPWAGLALPIVRGCCTGTGSILSANTCCDMLE